MSKEKENREIFEERVGLLMIFLYMQKTIVLYSVS